MTNYHRQSMRAFLAMADEAGTLNRIAERVDPVHEIAAWLSLLDGRGPVEFELLGAEAIAAGLRQTLHRSLPSVREVAVTAGGAGRLHAVVSLGGAREGAARRAIFAVWAAVSLVKQVTVVDGDVDPWDPAAVEHAVATRMRPERDLIVVPRVQADRAEPLEKEGAVGKLGIDATTHAPDRPDWTRARPPDAVLAKVRERIARCLGGSSAATPDRPVS